MYEWPVVIYLMFLCSVLPSSYSSHFLGGSIMVRPKPGGAQSEIEVTAHISWRRSSGGYYCNSTTVANSNLIQNSSLSCEHGCQSSIMLSYLCTEYNVESDWSYLEAHKVHYFCGLDVVTIGTVGNAWISPYRSWNISTTFSLAIRPDTGEINSSPCVASFPHLYLLEDYYHIIPLAISDPDNDNVRCRWATGTECSSVCDEFLGANLDSYSCTIRYEAGYGTGLNAAAIMIEDFLPSSNVPLSSVAHQFLVEVVDRYQFSCHPEPFFVTPLQGACINVPQNATFTKQLIANSNCLNVTITSFKVLAPTGTSKGEVEHIPGTNNYYTNITWVPTANQQNDTHLLCFIAINSENLTSLQSCIKVAAGYQPPRPIPESATPNHQFVYPSINTLQIMFDRRIQRPSTSSFIRFYASGEIVYQIDASISQEVNFNVRNLTIVPNYAFIKENTYHVNFDEGIVESVEGCHLMNAPIFSDTFWTFEVISLISDVTALSNQTLGQPLILQCSVTSIRDINSKVDFVWSSNGTELERVEGATGVSSTSNLAVYTHYYIISQLSTADNNNFYTCEVIINSNLLISTTHSFFTINIIGTNNNNMNNTIHNNDSNCNVDTICNNSTVWKDDDNNSFNSFIVLFAVSAGINLLLVAVITIICLLLKQKKNKPVLTNYRAERQCTARNEPLYDLPTLEQQNVHKEESQHYVNLPRHQKEVKMSAMQKRHVKPVASGIKLENNPAYGITT